MTQASNLGKGGSNFNSAGQLNLGTGVAGTLPVLNGGTGATSFTAGQIHYGSFSTSSNLFWDSTNNRLGIGTSSPGTYLQINGTHVSGQGLLTLNAASGTQYTSLTFQNNSVSKAYLFYDYTNSLLNVYGAAGQAVVLTTNDSERMRIDASGNVGIGTSSPTDKLTIASNSCTDILGTGYTTFSATNYYHGKLTLQDPVGRISIFRSPDSVAESAIGTTTNHTFTFITGNTERFRIGTAGELGIGGANYGTSGQALVSQGSGAAPIWATVGATAGTIIQVKNTTLNVINSTTSTSRNGASTGLSISITPTSASNKILVLWTIDGQVSATNSMYANLLRNGTTELGGTSGSNIWGRTYSTSWYDNNQKFSSGSFLDSPATTSATTYAIYFWVTGGTGYTNRPGNYPDATITTSSITVMEVKG